VTRRATQCRAVKQDENRRSTQNTRHIDGSSKNKAKTLQTNNLLCRSRVTIAATDRGITAFVRPAGHWSPSCRSFVPHVRATRVARHKTAAATEQQQGKHTTKKQLTFQKRCSNCRHRPWQHCIRSSGMPLVAIVPFIRAVANSHTRAASTNRSNAVKRRATQCRAEKHHDNSGSTQNTTHTDGSSKNKTKALQTNNLLRRSVVTIAATDGSKTVFVRHAGHWSPSCRSFVPHVRATRVAPQPRRDEKRRCVPWSSATTKQARGTQHTLMEPATKSKQNATQELTFQNSWFQRYQKHNCYRLFRRPCVPRSETTDKPGIGNHTRIDKGEPYQHTAAASTKGSRISRRQPHQQVAVAPRRATTKTQVAHRHQ